MRCRKCNHIYTPRMERTACPRCGYVPYREEARPERRVSPRRVTTRVHDRWAIGVGIACVVLSLLALVTGQLLILGGLTAVLMGGFMLWSAFFMQSGGLEHPLVARLMLGILGGGVALGGVWCWLYVLFWGGAVPLFPPNVSREWLQASGPYLLVLLILFAFGQLARLPERWVSRREQALQRRYREMGTVYPIPPLVPRQICWFVILISTPVFLLLFLSSLNAEGTGVSPEGVVAFPVIYAVLTLPMVYLIHRGSGFVVFTGRAVILRRLWSQRHLLYADIVGIRERGFGLPPNLVIRGRQGTLRIPRTVRDLPLLYRRLLAVHPAGQAEGQEPALALPHTYTVGRWTWLGVVASGLGLLAIWGAIALLPYWSPVISGQALPSPAEFCNDAAALPSVALLGGLTGLLFIPAILVGIGISVAVRQPYALVLTGDEIRWRRPFAVWESRPAGAITRIELEPVQRRVRARYEGAVATAQYTVYTLRVHFRDGPALTIGQTRANQWHVSPERLRETLRLVYRL